MAFYETARPGIGSLSTQRRTLRTHKRLCRICLVISDTDVGPHAESVQPQELVPELTQVVPVLALRHMPGAV
jgi:hypothetical protein